jgi:hypothetical protein
MVQELKELIVPCRDNTPRSATEGLKSKKKPKSNKEI